LYTSKERTVRNSDEVWFSVMAVASGQHGDAIEKQDHRHGAGQAAPQVDHSMRRGE
jgi:hypothetical protein